MASFIYDSFSKKIVDGTGINLGADTIKVALLTSSYTPSRTTHANYSDLSNEVANGSGYTTGGATLAGATLTEDTTNHWTTFSATNPSWATSSFTARYAAIYKFTGVGSTSPLIALIDFGQDLTTSNGTFAITFNAAGILRVLLS